MPCKIQIRQNITSVVEEKTNGAINSSLPTAQAVGDAVNAEFKNDVVSFSEENGKVNRDIHIPSELVDVYYNHEMIQEQARKIPLQEKEKPSEATPEIVTKVKEACTQMGIKILELEEYAKKNPAIKTKGLNGIADLTQKTIAVAQGMESVALTEEMVHMATAILEQTDPKLITELISKIDRFKIYNITYNAYKNNKYYQTGNGKPDIRKIKKEAVDRLIAELIVHGGEGSENYPELAEEREVNMILSWWNTIRDYIKGVYKRTNIDIFNTAADQILNRNIGTVEDIVGEGVFLQQATGNKAVDDFYATIINHDDQIVYNPESVNDTRHYMYQGTTRVESSVTEAVKKESPFNAEDRTELQKINDKSMMFWGTTGHDFLENYISKNLIDKNGYALQTRGKEVIKTDLSYKQVRILEQFADNLIDSYKNSPGTRFIVERKVINTEVKGLLASKVDFVAIEPDAKTGFKVDTYDWKFSSIDKGTTEDIPWYKQKEWKEQMGHYVKIWKNYGAENNQIRKSRMIPFIAGYEPVSHHDPTLGKRLTTIEVGDPNDVKNTELHMLPVPLNTESTDNAKIDTLLSKLRTQYDKLYQDYPSDEDKPARDLARDQLSKAIRSLHLKIDFEPLVNIGQDFLTSAAKKLGEYKHLDYDNMTQQELQDSFEKLLEYKASADKYVTLDNVFLSHYDKANLDKEDKVTLVRLEQLSKRSANMLDYIRQLEEDITVKLAVKENIQSKDSKNSVLRPEAPVSWLSRTMLEGSKLPAKIIQLAANLIMNANNLANYKISDKINDFSRLLVPLEEEAKKKGKKAFDLIGKIDKDKIHLIKKFDEDFWNKMKDAKEKGDKSFLISLIDKDTYNQLVDEYLERGIEEINNTTVSSDDAKSEKIKENKIRRLRDAVDMGRETFNGFKDPKFKYLLNQSINEEKFFSKEFREMKASDNAYKMWQFFTDMNKRAKDMGYLGGQGASFMPLIEASILQKFSNTEDVFKESKDFFKDMYTVKINEQQTYSKIDPETGKPKKQIPKYFTRTDKDVKQLSTDLNKIGTLWIEALEKYETSKNLESTLQILHAVEKAKGSLILAPDGSVQFNETTGDPDVNKDENRNADILMAMMDDALYRIQEDLNSLGNIKIGQAAGKLFKDEEKAQEKVIGFKKTMSTLDTWVKVSAVGLKPLIGIANWAGYNFQAFINNGDMYTFKDFQKNNAKILARMSTKEKALIHHIMPLNEDIAGEKRRQIAWKQGKMEWLSTFSFTDVMMASNSFPERKLQYANAMSFIDNSMIKNGKIVNIRQELKREDNKKKYAKDENGKLIMSFGERKAMEKTFEARVAKTKEESSLINQVEMNDDGDITIPGVSLEQQAKFRTTIIEYGRNLSGQMNADNKAGFRRDSMLSSFMMFKGWIPKQVHVRGMELRRNTELDSWEYGRTRALAATIAHLGKGTIGGIRDIVTGNEAGLKAMDEMLAQKKIDHYKKTGQHLEITQEEFYDLMRSMLVNQFKELGVLIGLLGLVLAAKAAEPPEDATLLEKNRYKFWMKMTNKISDEVSFYYNPASMDAITRGSILPALGLALKAEQAIQGVFTETYGHLVDDEDIVKDSHPTKYFLNLMPVGGHFFNEVMPYFFPDTYKEMGGRVTVESRRR